MTPQPGSKIVVLTPVRNEAWCLEGFIECASEWADHILISDQGNDGEPARLASFFPKVEVIINGSKTFNERENRTRLLQIAREKYGLQWIFCVDADERLSADVLGPSFRDQLNQYSPGTALRIPFANVAPDLRYWEVNIDPIAFLDDGREPDNESEIHFPRTCFNQFPESKNTTLKLLHLQYLDPKRVESKIEWYKLHEVKRLGASNPVRLFRRYSHQDAIRPKDKKPLPFDFVSLYFARGVNPLQISFTESYWWSEELTRLRSGLSDHNAYLLNMGKCDGKCLGNRTAWLDHLIMAYLRQSSRLYKPKKTSLTFVFLYALDKIASLFVSKLRGKTVES